MKDTMFESECIREGEGICDVRETGSSHDRCRASPKACAAWRSTSSSRKRQATTSFASPRNSPTSSTPTATWCAAWPFGPSPPARAVLQERVNLGWLKASDFSKKVLKPDACSLLLSRLILFEIRWTDR